MHDVHSTCTKCPISHDFGLAARELSGGSPEAAADISMARKTYVVAAVIVRARRRSARSTGVGRKTRESIAAQ